MSTTREHVIEIRNLRKEFRVGFFMRKVHAVRDVSLEVGSGEIFGLLGPNGAGKTTTLKALMSLIRPTAGQIRIMGRSVSDRSVYRRVGFLPENPYFYDYLRPLEFLEYQGALFGLPRRLRKQRAARLMERVGLRGSEKRALRKFSKGMLQRIGMAQALIGDPAILVLDEPMSGLDPVGRKEVRELMLSLKERGITILFSSHILTDVESICDRVAVISEGAVGLTGELSNLLKGEARRSTVQVQDADGDTLAKLEKLSYAQRSIGNSVFFEVEGDEKKREVLELIAGSGAVLVAVVPHRETLEDIFIRDALASAETKEKQGAGKEA